MKILIDTDLLLEKEITIEEYCLSALINDGDDGFFQLARYNAVFPLNKESIISAQKKGLVNFSLTYNDGDDITMYTLVPSNEFEHVTEKEHVSSWIEEWRELWPRGVKSGGYRVKSSLMEITTKMKIFTNRYPYSKDIIMEATKNFLERKAMENFAYIKLAKYFILKDGESTLADECEAVLEDIYSPIKTTISYGEAEL